MYMDVHRLRGTQDVQPLKMVQMLAQPPDFAIYIYSSDVFIRLLKQSAKNFKKFFANGRESHHICPDTVA